MSTIEHGTTKSERWLHRRRTAVAVWLALLEGVLIVLGQFSRWVAFGLGIVLVAGYFVAYYRDQASRRSRHGTVHDVFWILAVCQCIVIAVAVLFSLLKVIAVVAIAVVAIAGLVVLLGDRSRGKP